jgi:glycosyltransferase involved in cell wall biosynthesis
MIEQISSQTGVTVIAPVPPFRGGIARHSLALCNALAARGDVRLSIESFGRLYPNFLYPGDSDRSTDVALPPALQAAYDLDTVNPLNWRRIADRIADSGNRIVVMPAWTFFTAPVLGYLARRLHRRGVHTVMVVHNACDHEAARWKNRMLAWQLAAADRFVTHTAALEQDLRAIAPATPTAVIGHPPFTDFPVAIGNLQQEFALELLMFGLVRPYKGLDLAIEALSQSNRKDIRLTVAGEFWQDVAETRAKIEQLGLAKQVEIIPRYVADQEAAELFARSDAVLAPYLSVTGSGVVALATHYRRPVIASDLPGLVECVRNEENGWLFECGSVDALSNLLRNRIDRKKAQFLAGNIHADEDDGWNRFAALLLGNDG